MTLVLIILIILFLAVGGLGVAFHLAWWALILIGLLILIAIVSGRRGSGPPV